MLQVGLQQSVECVGCVCWNYNVMNFDQTQSMWVHLDIIYIKFNIQGYKTKTRAQQLLAWPAVAEKQTWTRNWNKSANIIAEIIGRS